MLTFLAALGGTEIMIILGLIILFFGATKIPDLARALGRAKGEFEAGTRDKPKPDTPVEDAERERVLKAARELGIPTEGRSLSDVKADVRAKLS